MSDQFQHSLFANSISEYEQWDETPLPLDYFRVRAINVLRQLNISSVGAFLRVDWQHVECWQLGEGTRNQLTSIQQEALKDLSKWAEPSQIEPTNSDQWTIDFDDVPLQETLLSVRARKVLLQNQITSLGAFLRFDPGYKGVRQLGDKTRNEILDLQAEIGMTSDEVTEWLSRLRDASSPQDFFPASKDLQFSLLGKVNLPTLWPSLVRAFIGQETRDYDVLKRRNGLDGSSEYSLEDLGHALKISRARVGQIE